MSSQENTQGQEQSEQDIINVDSEAENAAQSMLFARKTTQPNDLSVKYKPIRQGNATNKLASTRATKKDGLNVNAITGAATIQKDDFSLSIIDYIDLIKKKIELRTTTIQLFDAVLYKFTDGNANSQTVEMSLTEYMELRGLKDRKAAKEQVGEDLTILAAILLSFSERKNGKLQAVKNIHIATTELTRNGTIIFKFDDDFYNALQGYPVMQMPLPMFKINTKRNPNSYNMLRKIIEHKNMNAGKKNENLIAVKTLLKSAPYLPTIEEVAASDRHYTKRIIEPFERDLSAIPECLQWEYCHSNGEALTDEELKTFDIETFSSLLIHFWLTDYPEEFLEARKERKQEQIKKRKEAKNRAINRAIKKKEITESGA